MQELVSIVLKNPGDGQRLMPMGKIIAQAAHAHCKLFIGAYDFIEKKFRVDISVLYDLIEKSVLFFVDQVEYDLFISKNIESNQDYVKLASIIDAGHTMFEGNPTFTACSFVKKEIIKKTGYKDYYEPTDVITDRSAKMSMILDVDWVRSIPKKNKYTVVCVEAIKQYAYALLKALERDSCGQLNEDEQRSLRSWCLGSFAKVVLRAEQSHKLFYDMTLLPIANKYKSICGNIIVLGPDFNQKIQQCTLDLKML